MKLKLLIIAIMVSAITIAQDNKTKFGKVSKEEVLQKEHHLDKDAEAAILFKKERVFYNYDNENGFRTYRDAHYRIKVYKASGLNWGTLQIPLYTSNSGEENISSIKGYTYNFDNGKVSETKLKKESIFKENFSRYRNKVSIAMPEVRAGSVIDIEYRIVSDFAGYIDDFRFQYGIPVNMVDINIEIPEYLVFKRYSKGFYPIDLKQSKKNRKIQYQTKGGRNFSRGEINQVSGSNINRNTLDFFENVYSINAENIPSLKEVDFTDNINNYRSALKFELASVQFPNSPYKNYSLTWDDVAESIYKYDSFGGELDKERVIREAVNKIKLVTADSNSLVQKIFEHVRDRMTWDGYNGYTCESGIKKAYEERKGNSADINLMLTTMLRYAGFKANPVLVSTKSHGIPLFPTSEGFNYVISAIENGDSLVLLDATNKVGSMNILPSKALNWKGRLIRENGSSLEIDLTPKNLAKNIVFVSASILEDGSIKGKIRRQFTHNLSFDYRDEYQEESFEDIVDAIEINYDEIEVDDLEIKNKRNCTKPIIESFSFAKEKELEVISGKLYFKPALFMGLYENPFKMEKRDYPVDFQYPKSNSLTINIEIPDGYIVESLPENIALGLPDGLGSFNYTIVNNGRLIQFRCITDINAAIFPPNYYESLKEFYKQIVLKQTESVVLVKA